MVPAQVLVATTGPALGEATVEDEVADSLRVPHRVGDRDGTALGDAEQREALEARGVDDGLEVADEGVEGDVVTVPVGQAVAALVVAQQRVALGQPADHVPPDRALPVELQVVQPVGGLDERGPLPGGRPGNAGAVGGRAEPDLLLHGASL